MGYDLGLGLGSDSPIFLLGLSLVLGSGLGLGSNAVFISGSKIRTRSGEILGSWFGTRSRFGHGLYFGFGPKHLIGTCSWFGIRSRFLTRSIPQVRHKKLDRDLILTWDTVLVQTRLLFWVHNKEFKWNKPLVFNLGFCLGLNLSFILGLGLRNSM